jgi:hypothetical protein
MKKPTIELSERMMDCWYVYGKDQTYRMPKYHACLKGNEGIWSCGRTPHEALQDLFRSHPETFPAQFETPCVYIGRNFR